MVWWPKTERTLRRHVALWSFALFPHGACLWADTIEIKTVVIKVIEEVEVPAREEGQLQAIPVQVGQLVSAGEVLGQLDDTALRLQLEQAELELKVATLKAANEAQVKLCEVELRVVTDDLNRNRASREKFTNSVSQSEVDHLELKVAAANQQLTVARRELEISRLQQQLAEKTVAFTNLKLRRHQLISPLHGMVVELFKQTGDWMKPGDRLARVILMDRLRAEGFVDLKDATPDLLGKSASVIIEVPGRRAEVYPGRIVFVSPEVDTANSQTRIWAEVGTVGRRLDPGLRGRMTIEIPKTVP